jgi:hemolysin III
VGSVDIVPTPMFEEDAVPPLRGLLHAYAGWFALAAAIALVLMAPTAQARAASAIYGLGLTALFAVSGLYHRWRWDMRWRPLMRRMDHSTIFIFIAASCTPVAWLVLDGPLRTVSLVAVWAGAAGGIALSVAWITAPRILVALSYLVVGWAGVIGVPQIADRLPATPLVLLASGGVLYTVGAVVYALKRPNPWPRVFGFHEVFHALVVAAAIVHFIAMAGWVVPFAAG